MAMYFKRACWKHLKQVPGLPETQFRVQAREYAVCRFTLQTGKDFCPEFFAHLRSDEVGAQNPRTVAAWFPQYAEVEEVVLTGV